MKAVYLFYSIITTFFTSPTLSLLLPLHILHQRLFSTRNVSVDGEPPVPLYEGTVWHERRRPVHHSFGYNVWYACIDLDRASHPHADYFSAVEARRIAETNGPVCYTVAYLEDRKYSKLAPFGGFAFIAAWASLAF